LWCISLITQANIESILKGSPTAATISFIGDGSVIRKPSPPVGRSGEMLVTQVASLGLSPGAVRQQEEENSEYP
jgi:hypothetical protein